MPQRIDHVIALGNDLDALEAAFTRLGFAVVGGGTHPHMGTKNRIILLEEGYLELLAVADPDRVSPVLIQRLPRHPGWVGCALQSDDIQAEAASMTGRGVDLLGPHPGRLVARDGRARSWRAATIGSDDLWAAAEPVPFLIQHDSSGEQHRRELAGLDAVPANPNGARGLEAVFVAVHAIEDAAKRFAVAYGLRPASGAVAESDTNLGARTLTFSLASGEHLILAEPISDGVAARRLTDAGEGLCHVTMSVADFAATRAWLATAAVPYSQAEGRIAIPASESGGASIAFVETAQ